MGKLCVCFLLSFDIKRIIICVFVRERELILYISPLNTFTVILKLTASQVKSDISINIYIQEKDKDRGI